MAERISKLEKERILSRFKSVEDLPTMPQVMIMIRSISESPKSSAADLANVILKDTSLTSKILRVANSAMYTGYSRQISSVTQAVVLMGFQAVRSVAFGVMVLSMLKSIRSNKDFDFQSFWQKSVKIGVAARMLAVLLHKAVPEEAFVAGFLCDIGELLIGQYYPEEYKNIAEQVKHWTEQSDVETGILKVNHNEVGEWIADEWKFPKQLVEAIANHHHPTLPSQTQKSADLTDIVYVANWIANLSDREEEQAEQINKIKSFADIFLGLSPARVDILLERFPDQVDHALHGLGSGDDDTLEFADTIEEPALAEKPEIAAKDLTAKLRSVESQIAMLYEVSSALTEVEDANEAYQIGLEGIFRTMQLERIILFLVNPKDKTLEGIFGFGIPDQKDIRELKFPANNTGGVLGRSVAEQRIFNITDVRSKDFRELISGREVIALQTSSFVTVPIRVGQQATGVIFGDNQSSRKPVSEEEVRTLDLFVKQIELALARFKDKED